MLQNSRWHLARHARICAGVTKGASGQPYQVAKFPPAMEPLKKREVRSVHKGVSITQGSPGFSRGNDVPWGKFPSGIFTPTHICCCQCWAEAFLLPPMEPISFQAQAGSCRKAKPWEKQREQQGKCLAVCGIPILRNISSARRMQKEWTDPMATLFLSPKTKKKSL